jgi:hypothetical protein
MLSEVRRTEVRVPPHHSFRLPGTHLLHDVERDPFCTSQLAQMMPPFTGNA